MTHNPSIGPGGAAGSYSVSDTGCRGDTYALSPKPYAVPGYLREYETLRQALRVSVDDCALQHGQCYVLRAPVQRCGQRCSRGECGALGNAGAGAVRRAVQSAWQPVAHVTPQGVSLLQEGCVLPLWQRIFHVGGEQNQFVRRAPGMLYQSAVQAAMRIARVQGAPRVVFAASNDRGVIPVVYAHPGGIVRAVPGARGSETRVDTMSDFEVKQYVAASRGASVMPFNM